EAPQLPDLGDREIREHSEAVEYPPTMILLGREERPLPRPQRRARWSLRQYPHHSIAEDLTRFSTASDHVDVIRPDVGERLVLHPGFVDHLRVHEPGRQV